MQQILHIQGTVSPPFTYTTSFNSLTLGGSCYDCCFTVGETKTQDDDISKFTQPEMIGTRYLNINVSLYILLPPAKNSSAMFSAFLKDVKFKHNFG